MDLLVYPLVATFGAVLAAELVGDRSLYAVSVLSARFGPRAVLAGTIPAFALKALAAVLFGETLRHLSPGFIAAVSATTFAVAAVQLWRGEERDVAPQPKTHRPARGAVTAFATIFFSEWADPGQLAAAAMAVRFGPRVVWAAATLALTTKAVVASSVGARLSSRLAVQPWRMAAAGLFLMLGTLALLRLE